MSFERFVAARYFKAKRKGLFSLLTTFLGVAGVTLGVAVLVATMSVMNGFQTDIEKKVIGAQAHLVVYGAGDKASLERAEGAVKARKDVVATARFALGQAIVTYQGRSSGVLLKGLDPESEFRVNDLAKTLKEGSWKGIDAGSKPAGIVLGTELSKALGAWIGSEIVILSPQGASTGFGLLPKMKKFKVVGLLHTGYYEFDSTGAYAELGEAASFLGLKAGATGIEARLSDLHKADEAASALRYQLGFDFEVRSFRQMNQTLFAALRLEKYMMFLLLTFIILVASFNITSNLVLLGTEKLKDIGLLKAMGATPGQIRTIFLWEGALIGAMGVFLGLLLGLVICFVIWRYPPFELPGDIYYLTRIPVDVRPWDLVAVVAAGIALSLLSSVYPAWHASKANPAEVLQEA
ncbi:MAG: ABC transporter permease [Elusimicrobia bacterium]|nr:ABC transporter permease [Elusimicrobiota bacterium]